jgi:multiple antibiotic resistance protein
MDIGEMVAKLFPLLFNLMGPIALIPIFAALTARMDRPVRNAVALRATVLSLAALAVAVFLGAAVLQGWGVRKGSLIFAAGVILTFSVLKSMFFGGGAGNPGASGAQTPRDLAVSPMAFPTMVSPQAVGVLIIFVAFFPAMDARLAIFTMIAAMMVINLGAMRIAHWFMAKVGMVPLLVLGAVFGVLQVALGIEMIADGVAQLAKT